MPTVLNPPNGFAGLYWWLDASAISGVLDGGNVTSWTDLSGSGNTVNSPGLNPPKYQQFSINNKSCVRFNGATDSMTLAPIGSSADLTGKATWFVIYNSPGSGFFRQCLMSNENSLNDTSQWHIGINGHSNTNDNQTTTNPSGWLFLTNNGDGPVFGTAETKPEFVNNWAIRAERTAGPWHSFFLNGTVLGSSNAVVNSSNMQIFPGRGRTLGINLAADIGSNPLIADIAEIACYSRELSDREMNDLTLYFKYKYFFSSGGNNGCNLYTGGQAVPTTITSGVPLYTNGSNPNSSLSTSLYVGSSSSSTSGINLYSVFANNFGDIIPLYTQNIGSVSGGFPLYTSASTNINNSVGLYASGLGQIVGVRGLFTIGSAPANITKSANLFTYSAMPPVQSIYNSRPLFITGTSIQSKMNLYVSGPNSATSSYGTTLFLKTTELINPASRSTTLFVQNNVQNASRSAKLYVRGDGTLDGGNIASNSMTLYINRILSNGCSLYIGGKTSATSGVNLYTKGGTFNSFPLIITGGSQTSNAGINFYTSGPTHSSGSFTLYVGGYPNVGSGLPIYTRGY